MRNPGNMDPRACELECKQTQRLIGTKLKPTQVASALVRRASLVSTLVRSIEQKRVVLLLAPLGSGKTGLLHEWYARAAMQRPIAWLSLESFDDAAQRFFSHLAGAVRAVVDDFDVYVPCPPNDGFNLPSDLLAVPFLEGISRVQRNLVIVLDDFQHIQDPAINRELLQVLHHSPSQIRWVIAARQAPALNLGKLILQDQVAQLGARELNFDTREIAGLARVLHGKPMALNEVEQIQRRTGGWVAGVKLALLSTGGQPTCESLEQFNGSHQEVARYLTDALLRDLPDTVREFLIVSSIVDRMSGDLCDALLGTANGQVMLERVRRMQLFVQPLDAHSQYHRYHPLFLEFLRGSLRLAYPDRLPGLHRLASQWFAQHRMTEEALTHACQCDDPLWRTHLMATCMSEWVSEGAIQNALRWMEKLSRQEIVASAEIWAHGALVLIMSRRFSEATELLAAVESNVVVATGSARFRMTTLRLMLLILAGETDVNPVELDGSHEAAGDAFFTATLLNIQALSLCRQCKFDLGRRMALRARDVAHRIKSLYSVSYSEAIIRIADRAQGNLKAALERCEHMYEKTCDRRGPAWANAAQALAYMRYEQNRLEEAEALCMEVLPLLCVASAPDELIRVHLTLARIKSIQNRADEAFRLLDHLHSVLDIASYPRAFAEVCCEKIRLCQLLGDDERANAVGSEFSLQELATRGEWSRARAYDECWERLGFAQAALLMQTERHDESRAILESLHESARGIGYILRQITIEAAIAVCSWRAGSLDAAFEVLNRCLMIAQRVGVGRSLFDEVPHLAALTDAAVEAGKLRTVLHTKCLREFQAPMPGHEGKIVPTRLEVAPLTEREISILKLLAEGLSNKAISERSQVSVCTTKWHLRNVFMKLEVSTRTGAIARARAMQLIT